MAMHRTPLRYPGGKQKLTPFFREILAENDLIGGCYVEPYSGGAGVAMELLLSDDINRTHLNDVSPHIFSFWTAILENTREFCNRIFTASLTVEEWKSHREVVSNPGGHSALDLGFSTFFLNRCNRSGVLTGGVIGGLSQEGRWKIDARFSRNELIQRIEAIAARKDNISLSNEDAEKYLKSGLSKLPRKTLVYCDPPYFARSDRLYLNRYQESDHQRIAKVIINMPRRWVVSYDSHPEIARFYAGKQAIEYELQYNAHRVYRGKELILFSDKVQIPGRSSLPFIDCALAAAN